MKRLLLLLLFAFINTGNSGEIRSWSGDADGSATPTSSLPLIKDPYAGTSICFNPEYTAFVKIEANKVIHTGEPRVESKVTVYRREGTEFKPGETLPLPFFCIPELTILSADARYLVCLNENKFKGGAIPPNCAVFIADFKTKKSVEFAINDFLPDKFIPVNSDRSYKESSFSIKETEIKLAGPSLWLRWYESISIEYDDFIIHTGGVYQDAHVGGKIYPFPKVKIVPKDMMVEIVK